MPTASNCWSGEATSARPATRPDEAPTPELVWEKPLAWEKTLPAWRAVYAATLMANEQAEAAQNIIKTIPRDKLSPPERELIEPAK